jgi:hypothetical protein
MTRPSLFRELARVCRNDAEHTTGMAQWDHLHQIANSLDARADDLEVGDWALLERDFFDGSYAD